MDYNERAVEYYTCRPLILLLCPFWFWLEVCEVCHNGAFKCMRTLLLSSTSNLIRLLPWKPQMTGGRNKSIGHAVVSLINGELMEHFVFITTKWKLCMHKPLCESPTSLSKKEKKNYQNTVNMEFEFLWKLWSLRVSMYVWHLHIFYFAH